MSADLFDVLERSQARCTTDQAVPSTSRLRRWAGSGGAARRDRKLPDPAKLAEARKLVGSDKMVLDRRRPGPFGSRSRG